MMIQEGRMIRKSDEKDLEQIQRLTELLENREFDHEDFRRIYHAQLADPRYICFVWENETGIHGLLNMRMEAQLHHCARTAQITELIVDEECRGKGTGKQLFTHACAYAKEQGCAQIELETSLWRKRAHAFYEREGMISDHAWYTMKL
jgi:PhnO protein